MRRLFLIPRQVVFYLPDSSGRHSSHKRIVRYIVRDNRTRGNHTIIANAYTRKNRGIAPYPHIIAYEYGLNQTQMLAPASWRERMVNCGYKHAGTNHAVIAYMHFVNVKNRHMIID